MAAAHVARCGVFFGEDWSVEGTLSEELCHDDRLVSVLIVLAAMAPLVAGLVGTARAVATERSAPLGRGIVVGAVVPVGILVLFAISGFV